MSELLPDTTLTPELADFGITLLEKIHSEVREGWNCTGMRLWLEFYIKELKKPEENLINSYSVH